MRPEVIANSKPVESLKTEGANRNDYFFFYPEKRCNQSGNRYCPFKIKKYEVIRFYKIFFFIGMNWVKVKRDLYFFFNRELWVVYTFCVVNEFKSIQQITLYEVIFLKKIGCLFDFV